MTNETTAQQLRRVVSVIRRRPYPISDLISLLDKAATELECFTDTMTYHGATGTGVSSFSEYPDVMVMNKTLYYTLLQEAGLDND